jgi:inosose dehydratase
MSATIGSAPDSWGVWFPEHPAQTPGARFLDEVAEAGYRWIELGPYGYLPTDPDELERELERRGLRTASTFVMFDLEQPGAYERVEAEARRTCALLQRLGAEYLVLIDDVYTDLFTGAERFPAQLDDEAWSRLVDATRRVCALAADHGLRTVFHPHAQTHVEYEEQIERLLGDVDELALCLDVGHHAYCGGEPIAFLRRHHARIPYLHLKSVDAEKRAQVERDGISFSRAVAEGVFVEPADGVIDFDALRDALEEIAFDGFAIVEQDMFPAPPDKPLPIARRTHAYLREIGIA